MEPQNLSNATMTPEQLATAPLLSNDPNSVSAHMTPEQLATAPIAPSSDGHVSEPMPQWSDGYKAIKDRLTIGSSSVNQALQGWAVATGLKDFDSAQKAVENQAVLEAQQDTKAYANGDGFREFAANVGGGWALEQVPTLALGGGAMAVGAGAALALGAPVVVGASVGGALLFGALSLGHTVYELNKSHVDPNLARVGGLAAGILNGALGLVGAGNVARGVESAAAASLTSQPFRQAVTQIGAHLANNMQMQVTTSQLSAYTDATIKWILSRTSGATPYSSREALKDIQESAIQAFGTAPFVAAGTEAAGIGIGKLNEHFLPQDALDKLSAMLDKKVAEQGIEREQRALKGRVEVDKGVEDSASSKFEDYVKGMNADELWWFLNNEQLSPETRSRLEARWNALTNPEFTGMNASDLGDKPVEGMDVHKAAEELGFKLPEEKPEGEATQPSEEKTAESKPKSKRRKATKAPLPEQTNNLIDRAVVALKTRKDAARKLQEASTKAQGEGRDLTQGEKDALNHDMFINMNPDEEGQGSETKAKGVLKRFSPFGRTAGFFSFSQRGKLGIAFQFDPKGQKLAEDLDTGVAVEDANTRRRERTEKLFDTLEKETGVDKPTLVNLAFDAEKTRKDVWVWKREGGEVVRKKLEKISISEMMQYLAHMRNADAKVALTDGKHGNGFTMDGDKDLPDHADSTETTFRNEIAQADIHYPKMIDAIITFYDELGKDLQKSYAEIYPDRKPLDLQEFYAGQIRRRGAKTEQTLGENEFSPPMPGTELTAENTGGTPEKDAPSFTKKRGPSKIQIEKDGIFENLHRRIRQQAQWEAMAGPSQTWSALMNNPDFRYLVKTQFGDHLLKSLDNGYKDTVYGVSKAQGDYNQYVDKVMRARTFQILGLKPLQTVKHLTTLFQFALYQLDGEPIPPEKLLGGVESFFKKPELRKEILEWDEVKNRYADTEQLAGLTDPDAMSPAARELQKNSMVFFAAGDKPALLSGVSAVYEWVLAKTGDPVRAKSEAVKAFKNILASGSMDQVSDFSRHPAFKIFAQFKQPESRLAQWTLEAQRTYANHPTKENFRMMVRTMLITHMAAGLFVLPDAVNAFLAGMLKQDMKQANEKIFALQLSLMLGNQMPLMAEAMRAAATRLDNKLSGEEHKVYDVFGFPFEADAGSALSVFSDLDKLMSGEDTSMYHVLNTAIHAAQGSALLGVSVPTTPLFFLRDNFTSKPEKESK